MKRMYVTLGVARYVIEEWAIDIDDDDNPEDIFKEINLHPNNFFYDHDPTLIYSEDISDEIQEVIEWRTNEDNNRTT
jgi:hypothetical protein